MKQNNKTVEEIFSLIDKIYQKPAPTFKPGKTKVGYAGAYYDQREVKAMVDVIFKGWFGLAEKGISLENNLSKFIGSKSALLTNSGSSASLLAMSALSNKYFADRIEKGAEVITPACTFATTASSIVHAGFTPVFVDIELGTYNVNIENLKKAISKKTKVFFLPHTLGNPNDMTSVMSLAKKHNIYVVEDNCDALGSKFDGKTTGSFGILATCSFYPAHHITLAGEGGAVIINDKRLERIILSLRNWGRGCWCIGTEKNPNGACDNRFNFKIDKIPIDHKYFFTNLGYNLKPTEIQAAMGIVQLQKYPKMMAIRKNNFDHLFKLISRFDKFFILPKSHPNADPCWFSFPITIRDNAPFNRSTITRFLESKMIETRTVFAGNITRHPAFFGVKYRTVGDLTNSDKVLKDTFFVGIWPGLGTQQIEYIGQIFKEFLAKY